MTVSSVGQCETAWYGWVNGYYKRCQVTSTNVVSLMSNMQSSSASIRVPRNVSRGGTHCLTVTQASIIGSSAYVVRVMFPG